MIPIKRILGGKLLNSSTSDEIDTDELKQKIIGLYFS
jgi:hypothetical protein